MRTLKSTVLAVSLFAATVFAAPPAGGVAGFGDVDAGAFYTSGVQWMVDENITSGITPECFEPFAAVTRGQVATFMWRMEGEPVPVGTNDFTDVNPGDFFETAVQWMVDEGITSGTTDTTFEPYLSLNRAQFATFLWRLEEEPVAVGTNDFTDVPAGSFFEKAVQWMVDEGITTGTTDTTFSPGDTVTRGQVATFLWRYNEEPAVVVDDANPPCPAIEERDEFDGAFGLTGWEWVSGDAANRNFTDMPGSLTATQGADPEIVTRAAAAPEVELNTKVDFTPVANFQRAGLIVRVDDDNFINLVRSFCDLGSCGNDGIYFTSELGGSIDDSEFVSLAPGTGDVWLRLRNEDGRYVGSYSLDGTTWTQAGSRTRTLTDPTVGVFTGGKQGLTPNPPAHFDFFEQKALCDPASC